MYKESKVVDKNVNSPPSKMISKNKQRRIFYRDVKIK